MKHFAFALCVCVCVCVRVTHLKQYGHGGSLVQGFPERPQELIGMQHLEQTGTRGVRYVCKIEIYNGISTYM